MGQNKIHLERIESTQKLLKDPTSMKSDGRDIEFSQELADRDDIIAQQRSKAADERAKK